MNLLSILMVVLCLPIGFVQAQASDPVGESKLGSRDGLTQDQWDKVESSVERALKFLATQQSSDGSIKTLPTGQPGVTSLGVMAFLSAGHSPGDGRFADLLRKAVDFSLDCQHEDGLFCQVEPPPFVVCYNAAHTAFYNHGITGLMLGEVYGTSTKLQNQRIRDALPHAIELLGEYQFDKRQKGDEGGWRYFEEFEDSDSDMSCTVWQLMLLRSAKNAQFDVPEKIVDDAVAYVERCYDFEQEYFRYALYGKEQYPSGGAVGGAIVSLSMAGKHETRKARRAIEWVLAQNIETYGSNLDPGGNYHYGLYYGSQATYLMGGEYWLKYYPRLVKVLLDNQRPDGSWPPDAGIAAPFGSSYSTALAVLALTPPYQLLPIYQR